MIDNETIQGTLTFINTVRATLDAFPLQAIQPGLPCRSRHCPISNSLADVLDGVSTGPWAVHGQTLDGHNADIPLSPDAYRFRELFDDGKAPQFDSSQVV